MNATEIRLSQAASISVQLLRWSMKDEFAAAVKQCNSINDVPEPYQGWIRDPKSIPASARSKRFGGTSNQ